MLARAGIAGQRYAEMLKLFAVVNFYGLNHLERTDIIRIGHHAYRQLGCIILIAAIAQIGISRSPEIHFAISEVTVDLGRDSINQAVSRHGSSRSGGGAGEEEVIGAIY